MIFQKSYTKGVFFVDRARLQFYGSNSPHVLAVEIPTDVIRDLDILNREALATLLRQLVEKHTIEPCPMLLVLSADIYFEQTLEGEGEKEKEAVQAFSDALPFVNVKTRVYALGKRRVAVGANKQFLETLVDIFGHLGFRTRAVIPVSIISSFASYRWLDEPMGRYVLEHFDELRSATLVPIEESSSLPFVAPLVNQRTRPKMLVAVFVFLLFVLFLLIILRQVAS